MKNFVVRFITTAPYGYMVMYTVSALNKADAIRQARKKFKGTKDDLENEFGKQIFEVEVF